MNRLERIDDFLRKEWLIFLPSLLVGLVGVPFALSLLLELLDLGRFYAALLSGKIAWSGWLMIAAPYVLVVGGRLVAGLRGRRGGAVSPAQEAA